MIWLKNKQAPIEQMTRNDENRKIKNLNYEIAEYFKRKKKSHSLWMTFEIDDKKESETWKKSENFATSLMNAAWWMRIKSIVQKAMRKEKESLKIDESNIPAISKCEIFSVQFFFACIVQCDEHRHSNIHLTQWNDWKKILRDIWHGEWGGDGKKAIVVCIFSPRFCEAFFSARFWLSFHCIWHYSKRNFHFDCHMFSNSFCIASKKFALIDLRSIWLQMRLENVKKSRRCDAPSIATTNEPQPRRIQTYEERKIGIEME